MAGRASPTYRPNQEWREPPRPRGLSLQRAVKPDPVLHDHPSPGPKPRGPRSPRPCGLPGPRRAGSTVLLGLAPGGVYPAAASPRRWCALTAPFHPCLFAAHVWPRHRRCCFCGTFPRVSPGGRYPPPLPCGVRTFLEGFTSPAIVWPAPGIVRRPSSSGPDLRRPAVAEGSVSSDASRRRGSRARPSTGRCRPDTRPDGRSSARPRSSA
jgi:hypothetical protein